MNSIYTNIEFHNQNDCEIFNLGGIQSITLDGSTSICTIECANGFYKSPYTETIGTDVCFACMKPYTATLDEYIEIVIYSSGKVAIYDYPSDEVGERFKEKCKTFLDMKQ